MTDADGATGRNLILVDVFRTVLIVPAMALFACLFLPAFAPSGDLLDDEEQAVAVTMWRLASNPAEAEGGETAVALVVVAIVLLLVCVAALLGASFDGPSLHDRAVGIATRIAIIAGALLVATLAVTCAVVGANDAGTISGLRYTPRPMVLMPIVAAAWAAVTAHIARASLVAGAALLTDS